MRYSNAFRLYKLLFFIVVISISTDAADAQDSLINYDEARIPPYILPDPLQLPNGKHVTTSQQWLQHQRAAMLKLFTDNVYGKMPGKPVNMHFKLNSVDSSALGGKAICKQVTILFNNAASAPSMDVLIYLPKYAKTPVPVFTGLNFYGNQTINPDNDIILSTRWTRDDDQLSIVNNRATEASRGKDAGKWAVEEIINRGYG
ncbi:MAG: hypothetical protein ABIO76_03090, partial [Ginsengibacter sp.]